MIAEPNVAMNGEPRRMRGWVEIVINEIGHFAVYDWSEHYDSGSEIAVFENRRAAVECAVAWGRKHARKLANAEIIQFPKGGINE